jgi:hypothetical protein
MSLTAWVLHDMHGALHRTQQLTESISASYIAAHH